VAAIAIVIATIGIPLSKLWLSRQTIVVVQQPAPAARPAHVEKAAVKKEPVVAAAPKVETPVAPPSTPAPRPAPKPAPRTAPKPTRPTVVPAQPAVEAPLLAVNAPSVTSLPAAEPVAVAAPPPPPPAAAMGPFFESRDVDRAPQVTSRIEPRVPDDVDQNRQEILIVRVLVSQAGQPTLVSLLRRSKSGSALDAAVVDAVKRWSFSPAIRRGEAVSCFLNVGVPVGSKP
jgi:protein TonB